MATKKKKTKGKISASAASKSYNQKTISKIKARDAAKSGSSSTPTSVSASPSSSSTALLANLQKQLAAKQAELATVTGKATTPAGSPTSTYAGTSVVDFLGSTGQASDFSSRAKLAAEKGIQGYTGTADQNTQLLETLRGAQTATPGQAAAPGAPTPTTPTTVVPHINTTLGTPEERLSINEGIDNVNRMLAEGITNVKTPEGETIDEPVMFTPQGAVTQQTGQVLTNPPVLPQEQIQQPTEPVTDTGVLDTGLPDPVQQQNEQQKQEYVADSNPYMNSLKDKFSLTQSAKDFSADPVKTVKDIYKDVLTTMGMGEANTEIKAVAKEIEDLQNSRDDELRDVNDNPWLSEGARTQKINSVTQKWEDRMASRVDYMQLLENVRDDATQQAQFALGTALNVYDSERKFQADQIQSYKDQAQREFDNTFQLAQLSDKQSQQKFENSVTSAELRLRQQPETQKPTSEMQEYALAVQQGFNGGFLDYKKQVSAAGRAPASSSSRGGTGRVGSGSGSGGASVSSRASQILDGFTTLSDLTPSEATKARDELYGLGFGSDSPPGFFKTYIENQLQMNLTAAALQQEWIKYRDSVMTKPATSGGLNFDDF